MKLLLALTGGIKSARLSQNLSGIGNIYFHQRSKSISSPIRMLSTSSHKPVDVYVQILPVVSMPAKPDTEVMSESQNKILLCQWSSGNFKGRYTGLIKMLDDSERDMFHSKESSIKHEILLREARKMLPSKLLKLTTQISLVGLLRFDDPPACDEYIYIANVEAQGKSEESLIDFNETIKFGENSCFWFNWNSIPYSDMPADDEIWYPEVLWKQRKVMGSFTFGGWTEKDIKSYKLSVVDEINLN